MLAAAREIETGFRWWLSMLNMLASQKVLPGITPDADPEAPAPDLVMRIQAHVTRGR